jgi:hypothetical protein
MGLDMYAYAVKNTPKLQEIDQNYSECEVLDNDLHYWRKHHNLHGWMEKLYRKKGGQAESFNCVSVRLHREDLINLQAAILKMKLPQTAGFFFGDNPPNDESNEYDFEFIIKALIEIDKGNAVYYTSWW